MKLAMVAAVVVIAVAAVLLFAMPSGSGSAKKATSSGSDHLATYTSLNSTSLDQTSLNHTGSNQSGTIAPDQAPEGEYSMNIYVDKHTYAPRDPVNLTMDITVPGRIENAEIRFFGVKNKFGAYKLQRSMEMTLVDGINVINTRTDIPACTSCSGL